MGKQAAAAGKWNEALEHVIHSNKPYSLGSVPGEITPEQARRLQAEGEPHTTRYINELGKVERDIDPSLIYYTQKRNILRRLLSSPQVIASANVYALKDREALEKMLEDVRTKGWGPEIWDKYDAKGDIHTVHRRDYAPILIGRNKFNKRVNEVGPMLHVYPGTKQDQLKNMLEAIAVTLATRNKEIETHPTSEMIIPDMD